jgi:hypothetical protein
MFICKPQICGHASPEVPFLEFASFVALDARPQHCELCFRRWSARKLRATRLHFVQYDLQHLSSYLNYACSCGVICRTTTIKTCFLPTRVAVSSTLSRSHVVSLVHLLHKALETIWLSPSQRIMACERHMSKALVSLGQESQPMPQRHKLIAAQERVLTVVRIRSSMVVLAEMT